MAKEISKSRIPNFPVNLSGLVLFCIDTSDSECRRIFQHFSRSTRLSYLCTAPLLISALFCTFSLTSRIFGIFCGFFNKSSIFRRKFHGILPELWEIGEGTFPFSSGKRENGGCGEKGKRNRMPGKGKWQSSKSELRGQKSAFQVECVELRGSGARGLLAAARRRPEQRRLPQPAGAPSH